MITSTLEAIDRAEGARQALDLVATLLEQTQGEVVLEDEARSGLAHTLTEAADAIGTLMEAVEGER
jgi:hypothetical protein